MSNYLSELTHVIELRRKELSDVLGIVNALINRYVKITAWLRKRGSNKLVSKLLGGNAAEVPSPSQTFDNAKYIGDAIRRIDEVINEMSRELGIPRDLVIKVASLGPNVGIDEESIARELNMDASTVSKYLDTMWRAGLIDRKYVT